MSAQACPFKWPNDLLVGGRKLSGILLETVLLSGRNALVTGIGVNLVHSPDPKKLEDRAVAQIALAEMSEHLIEPTAFLDMLAPIMDQWERKWLADGFAPIRQSWLDHAIGVGEPIVARLADRELSGTYEMIDAHGSLILSNRAGRHVVPAAEIYFPTSERIKGVREGPMLLAVDVGNTNTIFAVHDGQAFVGEWRCATQHERTADEYFVWLTSLMKEQGQRFEIDAVIVSSVVPQVVFNIRVLCNRYFDCRPYVVGKPDCVPPVDPRVDEGRLLARTGWSIPSELMTVMVGI